MIGNKYVSLGGDEYYISAGVELVAPCGKPTVDVVLKSKAGDVTLQVTATKNLTDALAEFGLLKLLELP